MRTLASGAAEGLVPARFRLSRRPGSDRLIKREKRCGPFFRFTKNKKKWTTRKLPEAADPRGTGKNKSHQGQHSRPERNQEHIPHYPTHRPWCAHAKEETSQRGMHPHTLLGAGVALLLSVPGECFYLIAKPVGV